MAARRVGLHAGAQQARVRCGWQMLVLHLQLLPRLRGAAGPLQMAFHRGQRDAKLARDVFLRQLVELAQQEGPLHGRRQAIEHAVEFKHGGQQQRAFFG